MSKVDEALVDSLIAAATRRGVAVHQYIERGGAVRAMESQNAYEHMAVIKTALLERLSESKVEPVTAPPYDEYMGGT